MQSLRLHTSTLYLFSLLSLSWGTSCSKGCRTDDWEDTNTDTWATMIFRSYDAKKVSSHSIGLWTKHTPKKELKLLIDKLIFWTFWLDNKQVPTFIFTLWMWLTEWWREKLCVLTFTHWKFRTVYRPLAWTMAVIPTLVCLCEWYREIHYSY